MYLGHLIDERLNEGLEPHGLSLPKLSVLQHLVQAGEPLPLGVLSERFGCVKSNITQLVDRLEADKLVRRVPDPEDRRSVLAAITEEGRKRYSAGRRALEEVESQILESLSASDREQLSGLLSRFHQRPNQ
ncbi:MAG: MarR family transcriptional regulator [Dehalococcoidia bacterium]|nr:MarR family transcriptional regulator [Dehalococcoidia bacterium]